ncbi:Glycine--tRNA ligase [Mesomycoplasma conjunctivae]|uniref:glycine--tRNA ligase n=1 Tax=Mesomycoplasma conjunctivae (strain ATCC 25834 / NCTC 10147 / HRC/581) TaxID=572263 RepID=C5J5R8_MESCH|nr:glycine--tRNA ligase [Mesomycoplasma conjunctivae]CAT04804.1 Glycyl-tRNA synthetase [Mesomycoplasma conjunctivae]VEU65831.1 Glycine--tRNA ligase [Mesomycoplasma conjunctivae]
MQKKDYQFFVNHLKQFGFVFQGSEIYGGLANTWDYGHLGVLLANNIKNFWQDFFINSQPHAYLIDTKILLNPKVWFASGHLDNFNDLLVENKINKKRYRVDHLLEEIFPDLEVDKLSVEEQNAKLLEIKFYDNCQTDWSPIRQFNLLFETQQGVVENQKQSIYLRPETAQGIFINFQNILRSTRTKLPFAVGQIGKAFRNEITPGNFIFRTREFEQMELEVFCHPQDSNKIYQLYLEKVGNFLQQVGLKSDNVRLRHHQESELAHYSNATADYEFNFGFGWGELYGIAHRGDFDLQTHQKYSGQKMDYLDLTTNQKIVPHVIEPSVGLDRLMLSILENSFEYEEENDRYLLKFNYKMAPYKVAVLPLVKKLSPQAYQIFENLLTNKISAIFEEANSIGKRYRQQDAIGTPFCITFDYDSLNDNSVTIRYRDSMQQERIALDKIVDFLNKFAKE